MPPSWRPEESATTQLEDFLLVVTTELCATLRSWRPEESATTAFEDFLPVVTTEVRATLWSWRLDRAVNRYISYYNKCSKCRPSARTQVWRRRLHSLIASSTTVLYARPDLSQTLLQLVNIVHWLLYTRCCTHPQVL